MALISGNVDYNPSEGYDFVVIIDKQSLNINEYKNNDGCKIITFNFGKNIVYLQFPLHVEHNAYMIYSKNDSKNVNLANKLIDKETMNKIIVDRLYIRTFINGQCYMYFGLENKAMVYIQMHNSFESDVPVLQLSNDYGKTIYFSSPCETKENYVLQNE